MVVIEDTSQLERSALIPVSWKSVFMFVTFDVSKHLITSLFKKLSNNFFLAVLSFNTTLSGQDDWVIWGVGSWEVSGVGGWVFDPDPPFFPFGVWILSILMIWI